MVPSNNPDFDLSKSSKKDAFIVLGIIIMLSPLLLIEGIIGGLVILYVVLKEKLLKLKVRLARNVTKKRY